jgi:ABC-type transport system substrate-binding protein
MFRCDAAPPNGFNDIGYCNERFDELDALQIRELDVDKRVDLLIEQANILNDEVAVGVLLFPKSLVGRRETLHNFYPNGYGFLWSMPWWWTEAR